MQTGIGFSGAATLALAAIVAIILYMMAPAALCGELCFDFETPSLLWALPFIGCGGIAGREILRELVASRRGDHP